MRKIFGFTILVFFFIATPYITSSIEVGGGRVANFLLLKVYYER